MKRALYPLLLDWKNNKYRKPLILRGARQVGKTHLLKSFAKSEFKSLLYVNFEESTGVQKLFDDDLDPKRIIRNLGIYYDQEIVPDSTLIFFDEIQACPNALTSLKYFQEQANEYCIASAGSLLGLQLSQAKGFPVGKVNFLTLYPLTFFEFLEAQGKERLASFLRQASWAEPIPEALHAQAIEQLRFYYYIGGMPEAVRHFANEQNLNTIRPIHQDILDAYLLDFSKHAAPAEVIKITATWKSIPNQLAKENKKFIFSVISKSARSREYESAIEWLIAAGLIHCAHHISTPRLPIDSYSNKKSFKAFLLDVGLLSTLTQLSSKTILQGHELFTEFKGALTENFVAQELVAHDHKLYYWSSTGEAEVDFVIAYEDDIYPLEVKSGIKMKQKSLNEYNRKFSPTLLSRTSPLNLEKQNNFANYPLYLVGSFPTLSRNHYHDSNNIL
ncbi:MAG: DUF4143 domain-containing protein [Gammaproteobacteria bacterium]